VDVIELDQVSKSYGSRSALRDVGLRLGAGSALGLLGPNGAGKTTCLRLLLGFTRPTSGRVRLRGRSPLDPRSREGVAYLPERLQLPARMTVRGLLALHATLAGLDRGEASGEIDRVLELTGLADRARERIGSLSKGLGQRVGFAQAFLGHPQVLLLDEPTSGLDPIGIREARDWIADVRTRGCAVVVSSHVLSEVERTCDRVAIVDRGRVAAEGPIEELVSHGESLEDVFVRVVAR
jgi:ABC-type multidrug transport system ATPase subunit